MVELLAPAGSPEALLMAVRCGADAVYLGGPSFNARASAANFTFAQLEEAFDYCHTHNVKAYITLNTLLNDAELPRAYDDACKMAELGADAFIVQDLGLMRLLKQNTGFELHASTQMSIHNTLGVKAAERMGCKRVVLARETPLEEIRGIKKQTHAEIEVFAHGALCISFSGQCLFSSIAGGRSGNRGQCAQACRLPYRLLRDGTEADAGYLLSAKDLCSISYLKELVDAGVDSLKIEGRLKRPEYVGVVTRQYRLALDMIMQGKQYDPKEYIKQLLGIFNRGGFTYGYYKGKKDIVYSDMPNNTGVYVGRAESADGRRIVADTPLNKGDGIELRRDGISLGGGAVYELSDGSGKLLSGTGRLTINSLARNCAGAEIYRTTDSLLIQEINRFAEKERGNIPLQLLLRQEENGLWLTAADGEISACVFAEYRFAEGKTSQEDIITSLAKLGGTQYRMESAQVSCLPGGYIPRGIINTLRRNAVAALDSEKIRRRRCAVYKNAGEVLGAETDNNKNSDSSLRSGSAKKYRSVFAYTAQQLQSACINPDVDRVYYKPYDYSAPLPALSAERTAQVYFVPFDISFAPDNKFYGDIGGFDGIYAENLYAVLLAQEAGMPCIAGAGLNVLNCESAGMLQEMGCTAITASYEASASQIKRMARHFDCEVVVRGRLPMMKLVYCPRRHVRGVSCPGCNGSFVLTDRKGMNFEDRVFRLSSCRHILLNSASLELSEAAGALPVSVCDLNNAVPGLPLTKGHFNRGV